MIPSNAVCLANKVDSQQVLAALSNNTLRDIDKLLVR